jgi:hypothetical protein
VHRGSPWEVMADGLYAVEFGRAEAGHCNTYFRGNDIAAAEIRRSGAGAFLSRR